ncbi:ubiquinol oxidase subunit II [Arthrobacter sp. TPD3018]|uniref:ubiquinol oxidase subunit II n=1 Tax=Bacteria TaxID=2 RepID=UPI000D521BCB|nr:MULTISPECIES: ubiquinol oxidase subunit II [Bacteria]PVE53572.1 ubiquinol oxidase subunit II [Sphingomonas sp. TPD3009]PVE56177.1 ubiquinol oxidase subunit II [Arthrobacter sp. TPD3018]PVE81838.1 ubiquinol oxidase subunit II [Sphingomonas melonis]
MRTAALALLAPALLGGCDLVVMNPAGDVARQQAHLILWSTGLMLLIIVPVIALTVLFAWKYRHTNEDAEYRPNWDHSTGLELIIWSAPLLIVIALGALTWISTHSLDPYRPLARIAPGQPVAKNAKPLEIQVVSLDWKWLFIYPEQGIATVNELALPVNRQVVFRMTSSSVMNTFYVPTMAGMIYTMPGMETQLHAVLNKPGRFEGISANYSGAGFSDMRFTVDGFDDAGFAKWVSETRSAQGKLDNATYLKLERPSEKVPAIRYAGFAPGLFDRILGMCTKPGETCMQATMMKDGGMDMGHAPPVNDTGHMRGSDSKGALQKEPEEKGSSPHRNAPRQQAPGSSQPGSEANRSMTAIDPLPLPGVTAVARS